MPDTSGGGVPAWMPASVKAAYHRPGADVEDLLSGRSYRHLLELLARAGAFLGAPGAPRGGTDQASGYRHLLVLLALGIDEAIRDSDPYEPHISPANVDAHLKWGMDCPDAAYSGTALRGDASYRVFGHRGTARYVGLQAMGGMASTANLVLDDLECAADGSFEVILSSEPSAGNWMRLSPDTTSLVVRQFFYDWQREEPARIEIECLTPRGRPRGRDHTSPSGVARQLEALGSFVEESMRFWTDIEEAGRAQGVNVFREPVNKTEMGAAKESETVWGSWELSEDEALIVEVAPPRALYWSVSLGTYWWETIDYANHQSSLNGAQAVVDPDGVFRAVVAHRDPGVANWLDTAGHGRGPAIFRWVRSEAAPVPKTSVVALDEVLSTLPEHTAMVGPSEREAALDARRDGVRRRFRR